MIQVTLWPYYVQYRHLEGMRNIMVNRHVSIHADL